MNQSKHKKHQIVTNGKVGIFWFFEGEILAATWPLQAGEEYDDFINGKTDHVHFWHTLQKQHSELRVREYQEVPRGRVLFNKSEGMFLIYMDKVLFKSQTKKAIIKEFELTIAESKFLSDIHYTTTSKELDRIFSNL
jgi:hypothetical protein